MLPIVTALVAGGVALAFAALLAVRVLRADQGNDRMIDIALAIREGALAFLRREYLVLVPFVIAVTVVLWLLIDLWTYDQWIPRTAIAYLVGTVCSAAAGFIGMNVAIRANVRTAAAAMRGLNPALQVAFSSGAVMGITVVGMGLLGVTILYLVFKDITWVVGFGSGPHPSPYLRGWVGAYLPRPRMWGPTWWAKWRRASPKTTREIRRS